jgi:hypothetical protein
MTMHDWTARAHEIEVFYKQEPKIKGQILK